MASISWSGISLSSLSGRPQAAIGRTARKSARMRRLMTNSFEKWPGRGTNTPGARRLRQPTSLFALSLLLAFAGCRCPGKPAEKLRKVDVHTHFGPDATDRMISLMDQYGLDTVVNLSGGAPGQG